MSGPLALIQQGRSWLQEGEGPQAVAAEAEELVSAAGGDRRARAAWQLVLAEARLAGGQAAAAAEAATGAAAAFQQAGEKECEVAALAVLVDALLAKGDSEDAVAAAARAGDVCRSMRDSKGEAAASLQFAKAHLQQTTDPYAAACAAMASSRLFVDLGDKRGSAEALHVAARAHLLYDPEHALKVAKDAAAAYEEVRDYRGKAAAAQLAAAAKVQIATAQHAEQATSMTARGDAYVKHKWPRYEQQRGWRPEDPCAYSGYAFQGEQAQAHHAEDKVKTKSLFMRKAFKWTDGRHATDAAWFRQELRFLPPPEGDQ